MPLIYGEGKRSFTRLQEEIMKVSDDHSLFAWTSWRPSRSILATSPEDFDESGEITQADPTKSLSGAITVNNKGIHLELRVIDKTPTSDTALLILPCFKEGKEVAIYVTALGEGSDYYVRTKSDQIALLGEFSLRKGLYEKRSICVRQQHLIPRNKSMLPEAIVDGNIRVVKLLLDNGVELESNQPNRTPLLIAVERGHVGIMQLLLEKGARLESKEVLRHHTPLLIAVRKGHVEIVKLLLEKGAKLESKSSLLTPLMMAASDADVEIVKLLLEKGANLESQDGNGWTALQWATNHGDEAVVKLLLERGAVRIQ